MPAQPENTSELPSDMSQLRALYAQARNYALLGDPAARLIGANALNG